MATNTATNKHQHLFQTGFPATGTGKLNPVLFFWCGMYYFQILSGCFAFINWRKTRQVKNTAELCFRFTDYQAATQKPQCTSLWNILSSFKLPFFFFFLFLFFKFYFIFKLYIIVLVLPNIKMNLKYTCFFCSFVAVVVVTGLSYS